MSEEMFDDDFMDVPEEMDIPDEVEEEAISFTQDDANADPAKLGLTWTWPGPMQPGPGPGWDLPRPGLHGPSLGWPGPDLAQAQLLAQK